MLKQLNQLSGQQEFESFQMVNPPTDGSSNTIFTPPTLFFVWVEIAPVELSKFWDRQLLWKNNTGELLLMAEIPQIITWDLWKTVDQ